ncbi:reverse transcriptase domain-containing protein [Tanacetum coccineum]
MPQRWLSAARNRLEGRIPLWVSFQMFLDAYKGYHQIKMAKEDGEKTAFITSQGIFCYSKMPFGLKNAKATYQRLIKELPMLAAPKENEELIIYLAAVKEAISAVLMTERDEKQIPIYFVSYTLQGPEINYTPMEKLILSLDTPMEDKEELSDPWILFTDGSSCIDGSRAGLILMNPEGVEFACALRFRFNATNNEVEYEALIARLQIAKQMGVKNLQANVDSRLVANQVNRTYIAKESGPGKVKFLIVAIDYFTKWIEAKPVTNITGAQVKKFVWDNIVCIFGLPGEIVSDNGKQFRDNPFKDWCEKICIRQCFASVKHPQANGLVERANRSLGEGIKARNEETPFSLTYGTESVIPVEIVMPTLRTTEVDMIKNDEALEINLDLLEERIERQPSKKQKAKPIWKSTTMPRSATQVSIQETSSTEAMKQAMRKTEASSDLSGKDRMRHGSIRQRSI